MQEDTFKQTKLIYESHTAKKNEDLPFDVNNLCNFNFGFDVLKNAIEYLAKN